MANVYLPLGWPVLNEQFQDVIYQGTVARLYTQGADPRTDNQTFERKLLSDISKMRGSAGKWAKAVWRLIYGSKWGSVIYQLIRGDVGGYWSNALEIWDVLDQDFGEGSQQIWREAAPFQATYNDPGKIFFGMYWVMQQWEADHQAPWFYLDPANLADAWSVNVWWVSDIGDHGWQALDNWQETVRDTDIRWTYTGDWSLSDQAGSEMGVIHESATQGDVATAWLYVNHLRVIYSQLPGAGVMRVSVGGEQAAEIDTNGAESYQVYWLDVPRKYGWREIKIENVSQNMELIYFDGVISLNYFTYLDLDDIIGNWNQIDFGGGFADKYLEIDEESSGKLVFNFVGVYLKIHFMRASSYGKMEVWVDDVLVKTIDQNTTNTDPWWVGLGRFKNTLHHCELRTAGGGAVSFVYAYVYRKKSSFIYG